MSELTPEMAVFIQNDSGQSIPPRSIVVISEVEITTATDTNESIAIQHVVQFDDQPGNILVTGPDTIPAPTTGAELVPGGWWNPNNSYGLAYSDQRIYVAIDQTIDLPLLGEEWGPVAGEWFVTRGRRGFFADGYAEVPSGSGSGSGSGGEVNDGVGWTVFMRGTPFKRNWAKITSLLSPGTLEAPTTATVDVWLPDQSSSLSPKPYIVATDNALLGLTVTNRGCYEIDAPGSGSGSGSGSGNGPVTCRIEYDNDANEWYIAWVGRCSPVVTAVSCGSGGLSVTYGKVTG